MATQNPVITAIHTVLQEIGRVNRRLDKFEAIINADYRADDRLIPTAEAAQMLGVTKKTVINWVDRGRIPSVKRGCRHFFSIREIQSMIDSASRRSIRVPEPLYLD